MSYKWTPALADLREVSTNEEVWGKPIHCSFTGPTDGKDNIDGETATNHVLYTNWVAIRKPAGLGVDALDLEKVKDFNNENFSEVQDSKSKYGPHRSGPRIWHYVSTQEYDDLRKKSLKLEGLLGPNGERILRNYFAFYIIDGRLYGRPRSCFECDPCYEGEYLKCLNTIKCGRWIEVVPVEIPGTTRARSFANRLNQPEGTSLKKVMIRRIFFSNDTMNFFIQLFEFTILLNSLILLRFVECVKKQDGSRSTSL